MVTGITLNEVVKARIGPTMKNTWIHFATIFFILIGCESALSKPQVRSLMFSDCDRQLTLRLNGIWQKSEDSKELADVLQNNSLRKSKVDGSFLDMDSSASFAISGMSTLKKIQHKMTPELFAEMKNHFGAAVLNPLPQRVFQQIAEYNRRGYGQGQVLSFDLLQHLDSRTDSFAVYSLSEAVVDGEAMLLLGAQRHTLVHGCVVTMNFSFPANAFTLQDVYKQVWMIDLQ